MDIINLGAIVPEEDVPHCVMCGFPIYEDEDIIFAQSGGKLFLVHYECGVIDYYNA